jgi:reductive dehalogenase
MTTESESTDPGNDLVEETVQSLSRRSFFKRAAIGGTAALATGLGGYAVGRESIQGSIDKDWPENILADDFKPFPQRDVMWAYALSPLLGMKYPERNEQFGRLVKDDPKYNFQVQVPFFESKGFDNNKPGFTQMDDALTHASWFPPMKYELRLGASGNPGTIFYRWDQSDVHKEQYQFASKREAADAIRSCARTFGAVRCGLTRRDKRWDYDPIYKLNISSREMEAMSAQIAPYATDPEARALATEEMLASMPGMIESMGITDEEISWDKFPFEPKSVIVLAVPMDYDNMACAPSKTSGATVGDGYTKMATLASSVAKFIRGLGYHAVASGNDLGLSVAYGIAAGLGECGRNNQLLVPGYGPRVRLCKVYTDFEFVEYDEPRSWGITEFCKSCKKCGEACPSGAIDMTDDTHYYFNGEHSDQPGYSWSNHEGIKKFHTDAKKCMDYWFDSDTDCQNCAAACTFNEPDFWHHWFIMAINPFMPKAIHGAMAELHPAFGYGGQSGTPQAAKIKKFWKTGEGLRVNPTNRNVFGAVGKA